MHFNTKFNVPYSFFNSFRKAFFFDTFILSLYLLTMSFANEKHLTLIYNLIKFSKHNDLHSLEISMSQFSTMLSHRPLTDAEDKTSFTIVSAGRCVIISSFVLFLNVNSHASAMLTIHGWGDQSPPLEIEAIYRLCSVSTFIHSISA